MHRYVFFVACKKFEDAEKKLFLGFFLLIFFVSQVGEFSGVDMPYNKDVKTSRLLRSSSDALGTLWENSIFLSSNPANFVRINWSLLKFQ
jgi:hypothetical protein